MYDELVKRLRDISNSDSNILGIEDRDDYVHWTLDAAPTIIPADQAKEET